MGAILTERDIRRGRAPKRRRFFFGSADPAPSQTAQADDGALVTLCATERISHADRPEGQEPVASDFEVDFVHAAVLRNAGVEDWSGAIHDLNDRFGYSNFVLDPGGGGQYVRKQLALSRQVIRNAEVKRTPIVTRDAMDVVSGQFILTMYQNGAAGIKETFGSLAGDDVLKDYVHAQFKGALDGNIIGYPRPLQEWTKEELHGLGPEQVWTIRNLEAATKQLLKITQATKPDGTPQFTSRNARKFISSGRDDLAMACIYAYLAFIVWLRIGGLEDDDAGERGDDLGGGW